MASLMGETLRLKRMGMEDNVESPTRWQNLMDKARRLWDAKPALNQVVELGSTVAVLWREAQQCLQAASIETKGTHQLVRGADRKRAWLVSYTTVVT